MRLRLLHGPYLLVNSIMGLFYRFHNILVITPRPPLGHVVAEADTAGVDLRRPTGPEASMFPTWHESCISPLATDGRRLAPSLFVEATSWGQQPE